MSVIQGFLARSLESNFEEAHSLTKFLDFGFKNMSHDHFDPTFRGVNRVKFFDPRPPGRDSNFGEADSLTKFLDFDFENMPNGHFDPTFGGVYRIKIFDPRPPG